MIFLCAFSKSRMQPSRFPSPANVSSWARPIARRMEGAVMSHWHAILAICIAIAATVAFVSYLQRVRSMRRSPSPMTTVRYAAVPTQPPFTFRSQSNQVLASQTAAQPRLYGQVDLGWEAPGSDQPWRGSENVTRLSNGLNESYHRPMLSYDFESAGRQRAVHDVSRLHTAAAAGLLENGGGFSRTSQVGGDEIGYRDLVTADSMGTPAIIINQRV